MALGARINSRAGAWGSVLPRLNCRGPGRGLPFYPEKTANARKHFGVFHRLCGPVLHGSSLLVVISASLQGDDDNEVGWRIEALVGKPRLSDN